MHLDLRLRTGTRQGCRPHPALLPFLVSAALPEQRLAAFLYPRLLSSPPFNPLLQNGSKKNGSKRAQLPNVKWRCYISVSVPPEAWVCLIHLTLESGGQKEPGKLTEWNTVPEPQTSSGLVEGPSLDKYWKDSGLACLVSSTSTVVGRAREEGQLPLQNTLCVWQFRKHYRKTQVRDTPSILWPYCSLLGLRHGVQL